MLMSLSGGPAKERSGLPLVSGQRTMHSEGRCLCLLTIVVSAFVLCFTLFLYRTVGKPLLMVTSGRPTESDKASTAALAAVMEFSSRDSAKLLGSKAVSPLLDAIPGLTSIELPALNATRRQQTSPKPSPPQQQCQPPPGTQLCVPLRLSDLNSTCPTPFDRRGLACGAWSPADCSPRPPCLAVIVPYRNRLENLLLVAHQLHALLQRQSTQYGLYIVEQDDLKPFNRAKLLNIGYRLSRLFHGCDCYVFHDADKLPRDTGHLYTCDPARPRHLIGRLYNPTTGKYSPGKMYYNFFGGVTAITGRQFESANGNSNLYFGWGREDDELAARLRVKGWHIGYTGAGAGDYVNIGHASDITVNTMPWPHIDAVRQRMSADGLNSLAYNLTGVHCHQLFTLFRVTL